VPGARARFREWLFAVELARDEEARREIDGVDLAAAVVAAALLELPAPHAVAGIACGGSSLELRVHRLLEPLRAPSRDGYPRALSVVLPLALVGALLAGACFGEQIVQQVLGWSR
jgi:hypothetical protein